MSMPFPFPCKSSLELSRDMTGGRFVTNDNVDVRDRTRLERGAAPVVEAVTEGEPGGEDGGCSLLVCNGGND